MAEKISKAKQKKLDTANRKEFLQRAFMTAMEEIVGAMGSLTKTTRVRITFTGWNRYINLNLYGGSCSILIYTDGNVAIQLKEFCHTDYSKQIFEFSLEKQLQEEFLERFKEILSWLIPIFTEQAVYDFHSYMDYVEHFEDFEEAYQIAEEDWIKFKKMKEDEEGDK